MKSLTFKTALFAVCLVSGLTVAQAQSYTEDFDDLANLAVKGWSMQNNSNPAGSNWGPGDPAKFNAYNGTADAYIAAGHNSTTGMNTISNWLITPNRTLRNGDVFTFYTRTSTVAPGQPEFADRLEVRMSTNGGSSNVGSSPTDVGDFSTLITTVNPGLGTGIYPQTWTQVTVTVSGLPAPTSGRIAFRYFVTNGGPLGTNSDLVGIDHVVYTPYSCPAITLSPAGGVLTGGRAGSAYSSTLGQTGALGTPNFAIIAGALPPGLTMSASGSISGTPTATGTFNFTAMAGDASGCSGSQAYSITVVCPVNPLSFPAPAPVCSNDSPVDLSGFGSPAGGTYSGTGVSGGQFDPAAGTQNITYDYTDPYGCPFSLTQTLTVNTPPAVTQSPLAALCSNAAPLTLTGGSPSGGTYSGTGVTAGRFNPAAGTQTLTYTYTDANGCSDAATFTVTVNTAPTVTHPSVNALCSNAAPVTLSGGSPTGGFYSGNGVNINRFDPAAGTQTIGYVYTDANSCIGVAGITITVNTPPTVTQSPVNALCSNAAPLSLTGGSPAGGTYSGTGVTSGAFNPASGTQTLTYTYTDINACTDATPFTVTVNAAPTVTQSPVNALCSNAAPVSLTGGLPAGGTYTGTGITAGTFDPASGTQTLTYTYTDANGCSNETGFTLTVNTAPVVSFTLPASVCVYATILDLNATPAGGTYTGTGVTGTRFNPAEADTGNVAITYTYTAPNGCVDDAQVSILVSACLGTPENDLAAALSVYPNPATGHIVLALPAFGANTRISLVDARGAVVYTERVAVTAPTEKTVDLSSLAPGVYYLRVSGEAGTAVKTVIKQ